MDGLSGISLAVWLIILALGANLIQNLLTRVVGDFEHISKSVAFALLLFIVVITALFQPQTNVAFLQNYTVAFDLNVNIVFFLATAWLTVSLLHDRIVSALQMPPFSNRVWGIRVAHPRLYGNLRWCIPPLSLEKQESAKVTLAYPIVTAALLILGLYWGIRFVPFLKIDERVSLQDSAEIKPRVRARDNSWLVLFLDRADPVETKIAHKRVPITDGQYLLTQVIIPDTGFELLDPMFRSNAGCVKVFGVLVPEKGNSYEFDRQDLDWLRALAQPDSGADVESFILCDR